MLTDSVFSQYTGYFPEDKTVTPEKAIASELDKLESSAISIFSQTFDNAVKNAVGALSEAIAAGDQDKVKKYKWGLSLGLSNNLYGEWLLGWKSGRETGGKEVARIGLRPQVASSNYLRFSRSLNCYFNQPEPESAILRNRPAEEAIKARVNTLARDVSNSEWNEIKAVILDAIKPQSKTENPISRKELLKRINEKLGDRKKRFKGRAETIARTELTFAYNAGRLDSYVRSGLVAGVRFTTIFDERRCLLCASRQGIVVSLDDVEGLARLAIPVHPRCRCVWSPVLKTEFDEVIKQPGRNIKDRKLVKGKYWLAGGILAAILIPEELFAAGLLLAGIKALVSKAGSTKLARAAIAKKINSIGKSEKATVNKPTKITQLIVTNKIPPAIISPGIDLNSANAEELRSLIPNINSNQIQQIIAARGIGSNVKAIDLKTLKSILNSRQYLEIRAIARENYILNILHPQNNLTPSALWVNSGGLIPKNKTNAIFKEIKQGIGSKQELINLLRKNKVNYNQLLSYVDNLFNREYPI